MLFDFDHVIIGAADLQQGSEWAQKLFGAAPAKGGEHLGLGTHNLLARLPHGYLEIIAADPGQNEPPRWMGLENAALQTLLAERPRPIGWALNVPDLEEAAKAAPWPIGLLLEARRDDLAWRMATPEDGRPAMGVLPYLIEWPPELGRKPPVQRRSPPAPGSRWNSTARRRPRSKPPSDPRRSTAALERPEACVPCVYAASAPAHAQARSDRRKWE